MKKWHGWCDRLRGNKYDNAVIIQMIAVSLFLRNLFSQAAVAYSLFTFNNPIKKGAEHAWHTNNNN